MPVYVDLEAPKLWRRIFSEATLKASLLAEKWKLVLAGLAFQYLHGLAAHGVHYLHRPGPTLQDAGFFVLPALGQDKAFVSETLFVAIFGSFILWTFHPFVSHIKKICTVSIWCRVFVYLAASQSLRIITFFATQLPGPNYHCREGSKLAKIPPPKNVLEVLLINFPNGVIYGCGDLIVSSHTIFTLVFVRTYQRYGTRRWIKHLAWLLAVLQSVLIIASRKHYTVDIVVAWYNVNLVIFYVDTKLPEMAERSSGPSQTSLLPLSTKDGKNKSKEDQRVLNENNVAASLYLWNPIDHTLANAVRFVLNQDPRVTMAGYTIPHPSLERVTIPVQTTGEPAREVFKDACQELMLMNRHVRSVFNKAVAEFKAEQALKEQRDQIESMNIESN